MSDTLALSTRLRALSDDRLVEAVNARGVKIAGIKDYFDLADALLERTSIQQQLSTLDRSVLALIAAMAAYDGTHPDAAALCALIEGHGGRMTPDDVAVYQSIAVDLLLAETDGTRTLLYDSVAEQIRSWPAFGLPDLASLASGPPLAALTPAFETDTRFIDRVASERAFAATTEITELLIELEREPARELAKGGIALPDTKRLAHVMSVDLESVGHLVTIAASAQLTARESGSWLITDSGAGWLLQPSGERWRALADGWLKQLPDDLRSVLAERGRTPWGPPLRRYVEWLYPAGGEWMDERIATDTRSAELLGITANQAPSGPGRLLFSDGVDTAAGVMTALLPPEVDKVYLQHDLSIVAPGPLAPRIDYRLRSLADVESRALASSYRVSASSMNRAMASGETAASVIEFLSSVSLTGIPQPLDYLIKEAAARYGLLRAGAVTDASGAGGDGTLSYVRSEDTSLLGTILVDQNLSTLGFVRVDEHRVASRYPLGTVFWTLSDARYPVAAEDANGQIVALQRRHHARAMPAAKTDPVRDLIERLRVGSDADANEPADAWLARQLDTAIRSKAALTISVTMPNGVVVDYELEPTSMAGGRLRGRDRRSAIERTLPVSSITAIAPAEPGEPA